MRFLMAMAALAVAFNVSAQTAVQRFSAAVSGKCVKFPYSFVTKSQVPVKGTGEVTVQGNAFVTSFGNIEIYCDGVTRWTADEDSRELIIESVDDGSGMAVSMDLALIISELDKHFKVGTSVRVTESGKSLDKVELVPLIDKLGISSLTVWFTTADIPLIFKASVKANDGLVTDFAIPSMTFSSLKPISDFRFDEKKSDSSWVVTDLR